MTRQVQDRSWMLLPIDRKRSQYLFAQLQVGMIESAIHPAALAARKRDREEIQVVKPILQGQGVCPRECQEDGVASFLQGYKAMPVMDPGMDRRHAEGRPGSAGVAAVDAAVGAACVWCTGGDRG